MTVENIPIKDLKPYKGNTRKHGRKSVEVIANSIREFGFSDPVGIWGPQNIIVEGHGRYLAAKQLGIEVVPCIRLDHLTDEQRRAYAIAHNATTEVSEWDYDLLDLEMESLPEFDFEALGLTLRDEELEHEQNAEDTQARVERILGLDKGQFEGVGRWDIPPIEPVYELPEIREWIGFNYVLSDDDPEGKAVHFFVDDYQFERIWRDPEKYVDKLKQYVCVASPDFSPYGDMPQACQLFNHYRKHWVGAFLQAYGVKVIPTIRASTDERSLEWYLDGEPEGGVVLISNMWTNTEEEAAYFMREYNGMMERLKPNKVFVYGREVNLPGNVEYIDSFSRKRFEGVV